MADVSDCGVCPCCPGKTCLFLSCSPWCDCSFVGRRSHFSQKKCFLTACVALRDVKTKSFSVYFLITQNICPHATHTLCGQHDIAAREAKMKTDKKQLVLPCIPAPAPLHTHRHATTSVHQIMFVASIFLRQNK